MAHPQAPSLAALAALLADETRATFCLALLDGRAWTASELARAAQVSRPTTTEHLNRLVAGGLLTEVRQGRHRYLRLADDRTAHLIEELTAHAPAALPPPRTLSQSSANRALARARTCYDHLAGRLGVTLTQAMTHRGMLRQDAGFALTGDGAAWLTQIGVDLPAPGPVAGRWCCRALTSPSAGRIWLARSVRPCIAISWPAGGLFPSAAGGRCASPTKEVPRCVITSASLQVT